MLLLVRHAYVRKCPIVRNDYESVIIVLVKEAMIRTDMQHENKGLELG
jgi:hypothetical protein